MENVSDIQKLQGTRLQEVRKLVGSQRDFTKWLLELGFTGDFGKPYSVKTIAAWENGRRKIPEKIMNAVSERLTFHGAKIQYAYLNGDTDFITQDISAIYHHLFGPASARTNSVEGDWRPLTRADVDEIANNPVNILSGILDEKILPMYGHSKSDFVDGGRFCRYMYKKIGSLIEDYLEFESAGK